MVDSERERETSGEKNFIERIFVEANFNNRDNLRPPIEFTRERQSMHLKR